MGEKIQRIGRLLFGTLDWRRMASLITPGIGAGILVWLIYDGALWQRSIVALLTIDLVAGALSNATPQTNAAWRRLMRWHRWLFVAVHVCLSVSVGVVVVDGSARIILGDADDINDQNDVFCAWYIVACCLIWGGKRCLLSRIIVFDRPLHECNQYA